MLEIEFVGSGGQGSVVASKLLADAGVNAGYNSQAFASYGALRRGGEVESYIRLAEGPILAHSKIYGADYTIIMDEGMLEETHKRGKLKKGATIVINTSKSPDEFPNFGDYKIVTIDANRIAGENGLTLPSGMPIINTTVLGALWGLIPSTKLEQLTTALEQGKLPRIDRNIEAAGIAFALVKNGPAKAAPKAAGEVEKAAPSGEKLPEYRPKLAPCEVSCPAGERIERTTHFIGYGHFEDALESIKAENPFPGICGRVCFHPCEPSCNRLQFDEGVSTNALERAAYDFSDRSKVTKPSKKAASGKKVAVIGSGPAGMTSAYYLALLGHSVTVLEAQPVAGGVPRFGIPEYRLPKSVVDDEIAQIAELGVEIKLNTRVGEDIAFDKITGEYDATIIAAGAHRSMSLDITGEDSTGVLSGLDFLKRVTLGEKVQVGNKVAVIGGGNTAVDSARTAKRLGAGEVTIVYRRTMEEMPAFEEEVTAAEKEGIKIQFLAMPVQIHADGGKVTKLECLKAKLGEPDESGRRRPMAIDGSNFSIDVDTVIKALGESLDLPVPEGTVKVSGAVIEVDGLGRTSAANVYAAGDATSLTRSVVEAVASGKRAALGIDLLFTGGDEKTVASYAKGAEGTFSMGHYLAGDTSGDSSQVVAFEDLNMAYFEEEPRNVGAELPAGTRTEDFSETNLGLSKESAIAEAERCFHCGTCTLCEVCYISCPDLAITLDAIGPVFNAKIEACKSCGICLVECPRDVISWEGVV